MIVALMLFANCSNDLTSNDPTEWVSPIPNGYTSGVVSYFLKNDTIMLVLPKCECKDTIPISKRIITYLSYNVQNTNKLVLTSLEEIVEIPGKNISGKIHFSYRKETDSTNITISEIQGIWKMDKLYYTLDSAVSQNDSSLLNTQLKLVDGGRYDYLRIKESEFVLYYNQITEPFSDYYLEMFTNYMNEYSITLTKISEIEIEIAGGITNETVRMTQISEGQILWNSSDPANESFTSTNEKPCSRKYPLWFSTFLKNNNKIIPSTKG